MNSAPTFVVFSAAADQHHVAARAGGLVYRSIAIFTERERATGYAEAENVKAAWAPVLPDNPPEAQGGQKGISVSGDRAGGSPSPRQRSSGARPARPDSLPAKQERPPPAGTQTTADRDELVREHWPNLELTIEDIGDRIGTSGARVAQIAKTLGLPSRSQIRHDALKKQLEAAAAAPPEATSAPDPRPEADVEEEEGGELASAEPPAEPEDDADEEQDEPAPAEDRSQALSQHGVTLVLSRNYECIAYRGKMLDLTANQAALCAVLLRAAPHPVGIPWILGKLFAGVAVEKARDRLDQIERDLARALPGIGLSLDHIKNVGLKLGGIGS